MNYFQRSISIQNILKTFLIVISVFYLNPSLGEKKDFVFYLSCEETEVNMDSLTKEMTSKIKFSLRIKRQNANDYNKRMDIKDPIKINSGNEEGFYSIFFNGGRFTSGKEIYNESKQIVLNSGYEDLQNLISVKELNISLWQKRIVSIQDAKNESEHVEWIYFINIDRINGQFYSEKSITKNFKTWDVEKVKSNGVCKKVDKQI